MKKAFGPYRRLARGLLSCSSLWLADTHVLYVRGSGVLLPFSETYVRWPLAKVTGIALTRTWTGLWLNVIYGVTAALFLLLGALVASLPDATSGGRLALWILGGLAASPGVVTLALLVVNWALGPTCLFTVQTATQVTPVRCVRRLRTGRRVLAELAPVLVAAQAVPELATPAGLPQTPEPLPTPTSPPLQP